MIDLHSHSYYSDGWFSPTAVAEIALRSGVTTVALTDHDTTVGVAEMDRACKERGIKNVHGVECTAHEDGCCFHILGHDINIENSRLQDMLACIRERRVERVKRCIPRLEEALSIKIPFESVKSYSHCTLSDRHLASYIDSVIGGGIYEIFVKYLKVGAPYHEEVLSLPVKEIIDGIHAAGGRAIFAHPMRTPLTTEQITKKAEEFARDGLDGIEALYKNYPQEVKDYYCALAKRLGLTVTCGGDYHGELTSFYGAKHIDPNDIGLK